MSGIVGSKLNIRGSGLVGSLGTDGQHLLSAGPGVSNVFETAAGGGKLLQLVQAIKTDTFTSTTATTWTDITDLTVTTGSLATTSSRVLVCANLSFMGLNYCGWKIVDGDGADISDFIGDAAGSRIRSTSGNQYPNNNYYTHHASVMLIDSPASTSAQTYKIQGWIATSTTWGVNRGKGDGDDGDNHRGVSSIQAIEIGA